MSNLVNGGLDRLDFAHAFKVVSVFDVSQTDGKELPDIIVDELKGLSLIHIFSHVPVYIMSQEQLSMYATYMSVLGNREDLFGDSPYVDKYITNPVSYTHLDVYKRQPLHPGRCVYL